MDIIRFFEDYGLKDYCCEIEKENVKVKIYRNGRYTTAIEKGHAEDGIKLI